MPQGLYLYCLTRRDRLPPPPLPGRGLDDQNPLTVAPFHDLAAVYSPVPVEDFCGPQAEARLNDLAWIGPRVIRHQEAVAEVMRHSPVLPARFGTIFSSRENLEKVMQRHYDTIAAFLERIDSQEEWAVKGLLDRPRARAQLFSRHLTREAETLAALSPGKRYFEEQRLKAAADRDMARWLQEVGREIWTGLRTCAAEVRERPLLSREATGRDQDMVWNWALLVPAAALPDFRARIGAANARYANDGLVLEYSGPWPPYSFTPALGLEPGP
jgi:hypothetical protein